MGLRSLSLVLISIVGFPAGSIAATARPNPPGSGDSGLAEGKAVKIRNRAHELCKTEGIPFSTAFRRAEKEICGEV